MKKNFTSKSTYINEYKLPKINYNKNRISLSKNKIRNTKNNLIVSRNKDINIEKYINKKENKTEEIKKEEKINNKIDEIISEVNKKFNIPNKINNPIETDIKRENISSFFINDYTRKNFFKKKIKNKNEKEITEQKENNNIIVFPRITKEKMEQIRLRRNERLLQEKKDEIAFKKILEDYEEEKQMNKKNKINVCSLDFKIAVNKKKVKSILEESGIIDAYYYLINNIKKTGWPKKDIYEYSSKIIKRYEDRWKKKKIQKRNEITEKYFEDKMKIYIQEKNKGNNNIQLLRVLNEREANKFIQRLDRSRSTLHIIPKNKTMISNIENNNESNDEQSGFRYKRINIKLNDNNNKINSRNLKINNNITKSNSKYEDNKRKIYFKISINNKNENNMNNQTSNKNIINLHKSYDVNIDNKLDSKIINIKKLIKNK